ncbi:MAG: twin-arginine translocation signal domain-containing protein, partial [Vicinamibacterales bacterium]
MEGTIVANEINRRDVMKTGLAAAALGAMASFEWVLPAMAQGEVMVPFTDSHVNPPFNPAPAADR